MIKSDRSKRLSAPFHPVETLIGQHVLRPLSLATYDVLLRNGNPLVREESEAPNEGSPEFTSAIMAFIYTHAAPWPEVVRASFDPQEFRVAALTFCGGLTHADFKLAIDSLNRQTSELQAAQFDPAKDIRAKKP